MTVGGWVPIQRWEHVELGALVMNGKPEEMFFRFDDVDPPDLWLALAILKNWGLDLSMRFLRAREVKKDGPRRPAHGKEFRRWIVDTRRLADEASYVFGDTAAGEMRRAAGSLEESLSWAELRFVRVPADSRKRIELHWLADLWAFSEVFRLFRALGAKEFSREKFIERLLEPAIDELTKADLPRPGSEAWRMTIKRAGERIRPDSRESVIAEVLSAQRGGPFGPDGVEKDLPEPLA